MNDQGGSRWADTMGGRFCDPFGSQGGGKETVGRAYSSFKVTAIMDPTRPRSKKDPILQGLAPRFGRPTPLDKWGNSSPYRWAWNLAICG